jgi:drug/metabolite transporter (DMT)-like permease
VAEKDNGGLLAPSTPPLAGHSPDLGLFSMALIWGVNFPVIKSTLQEIPPLAFNALRFPLAALTVFLILKARGGVRWPDPGDIPAVVGLGILGNIVYQAFFILGADATLAGNASVLLATVPIWTLVLSTVLRHENPGILVWFGIMATLAGMVMVVLGGRLTLEIGGGTLKGDLLIVGAAVSWATYTVSSRRLVHRYGSTPLAAWTLWVGTVGLVALGVPSLSRLSLREVGVGAWLGVVYAGVLAIGLAYVLWNRGIRSIGSSRTAAYQNLTPVIALLVAWGWLEEVPSPLQLVGAGVVLAGLTLARLSGREKGRG